MTASELVEQGECSRECIVKASDRGCPMCDPECAGKHTVTSLMYLLHASLHVAISWRMGAGARQWGIMNHKSSQLLSLYVYHVPRKTIIIYNYS